MDRRVRSDLLRDLLREYGLGPPSADAEADQTASARKQTIATLLDENRDLKEILAALMLELHDRSEHNRGKTLLEKLVPPGPFRPSRQSGALDVAEHRTDASAAVPVQAGTADSTLVSGVKGHLEFSKSLVIPAIRGPEYMGAAISSPSSIVWLLYGTPLCLGEIVQQPRNAGKLAIVNLDLLAGFAQDAEAVRLLVKLGVAGVVSTRQSVLRAARAQGLITVQRTFVVDTIAVDNITRSLQHFVPDAIEVLPGVVAPLIVPYLRPMLPTLPVIATGLITTMRQVDEIVRCGITSIATSAHPLWIV